MTVEQIIARARDLLGATPAELDCALQQGITWTAPASTLDASGAVVWAVEELAAEQAGLPDEPGSDQTWAEQSDQRRAAAARLLDSGLREQLDAYAAATRQRQYVGWSRASTGPIQYADEPRDPRRQVNVTPDVSGAQDED